jgi:hypothetical protein
MGTGIGVVVCSQYTFHVILVILLIELEQRMLFPQGEHAVRHVNHTLHTQARHPLGRAHHPGDQESRGYYAHNRVNVLARHHLIARVQGDAQTQVVEQH